MRESRTYGSVRGALSNERPYRDRTPNSRRSRHALDRVRQRAFTPVYAGYAHAVGAIERADSVGTALH